MKKYGKYEFDTDSTLGELDLLCDQYSNCLEDIANAGEDILKATNVHDKEDARKQRDEKLQQKAKLELKLDSLVRDVGGFDAAVDFLTERCNAMKKIIQNPTPTNAYENGLYSDNLEYIAVVYFKRKIVNTDAITIKSLANSSIKAAAKVYDYLEETLKKSNYGI